MCTGFESALLSAALSGAGMLMQQSAADDAASQQRSILRNAEEEQNKLNRKKEDTIQNFAADTFNPVSRNKNYEDAATKNESSLTDALLSANGGEGEISEGAKGRLSNDYVRNKADATANAAEDILNRTRLMARSNAGGSMYGDESLKGGQMSSDLLGINAAGTRNGNATRTALGKVNNNGSLVGGLLMGAAPMVSQYKSA